MNENTVKATPVRPPLPEPDIVEVNMTNVHAALVGLGFATATLAVSNVILWRKYRRNEGYMDAMKTYVARLTDTECGAVAFQTLVDGAAREAADEATDWSDFADDEPIPYTLTDEPIN